MNKKWIVLISLAVVLTGTWIYGSATWFLNVKPGLSVGDIQYADRKDRVTNLTAGALGTVLQSAGLLTAPAYVAKNTFRDATIHNYATLAVAWTLSTDEALCLLLSATNANAACTIIAPATSGKVFFFRNATGQAVQFGASGTTGVSVTNAKAAWVVYSSTPF